MLNAFVRIFLFVIVTQASVAQRIYVLKEIGIKNLKFIKTSPTVGYIEIPKKEFIVHTSIGAKFYCSTKEQLRLKLISVGAVELKITPNLDSIDRSKEIHAINSRLGFWAICSSRHKDTILRFLQKQTKEHYTKTLAPDTSRKIDTTRFIQKINFLTNKNLSLSKIHANDSTLRKQLADSLIKYKKSKQDVIAAIWPVTKENINFWITTVIAAVGSLAAILGAFFYRPIEKENYRVVTIYLVGTQGVGKNTLLYSILNPSATKEEIENAHRIEFIDNRVFTKQLSVLIEKIVYIPEIINIKHTESIKDFKRSKNDIFVFFVTTNSSLNGSFNQDYVDRQESVLKMDLKDLKKKLFNHHRPKAIILFKNKLDLRSGLKPKLADTKLAINDTDRFFKKHQDLCEEKAKQMKTKYLEFHGSSNNTKFASQLCGRIIKELLKGKVKF